MDRTTKLLPRHGPARRCLALAKWPEPDRSLFEAATAERPRLLLAAGRGVRWRPATIHKNRRGYGRWLTFLRTSGHG